MQVAARGQRVGLAGDDAQLLVEQRQRLQVVAGLDQRQAQDRELDVALAQAVEQLGLALLDHRQEDAGVRVDQPVDGHRQEGDGRHRHRAHAQAALGAAGQQRQVLCRAAQLVEDGRRARREAAAVHGGLHAMGHAVEELEAERRFQPGDGLGDGRLRQVQHRRGLAETAVFEHGHEHAQLAHLQVPRQALDQAGGRREVCSWRCFWWRQRCRHDRCLLIIALSVFGIGRGLHARTSLLH